MRDTDSFDDVGLRQAAVGAALERAVIDDQPIAFDKLAGLLAFAFMPLMGVPG
jgi:hypothetical protein